MSRIFTPEGDLENYVTYVESFLDPWETSWLAISLAEQCDWRQEKLRLGGVSVPFPRLVAWHGDPGLTYRYSKIDNVSRGWTPALTYIRNKLQAFPITHGPLGDDLGPADFNGVLLNWYRTGQDSIGRHADDESDLNAAAPIVGVSLGATRTLRFRPIGGGANTEVRLPMVNGSAVIMWSGCQRRYTHAINKEPADGQRISLTFRSVRRRQSVRPA